MYIIETTGHGFKKKFTKEELKEIERLRVEMRKRLFAR